MTVIELVRTGAGAAGREHAVFYSGDGTNGRELWKSDGTEAGTMLVKDLTPGSGGSTLRYLATAGTSVSFLFDDGMHGPEPWISDGTDGGTALVKDINTTVLVPFPLP